MEKKRIHEKKNESKATSKKNVLFLHIFKN